MAPINRPWVLVPIGITHLNFDENTNIATSMPMETWPLYYTHTNIRHSTSSESRCNRTCTILSRHQNQVSIYVTIYDRLVVWLVLFPLETLSQSQCAARLECYSISFGYMWIKHLLVSRTIDNSSALNMYVWEFRSTSDSCLLDVIAVAYASMSL